MNLHRNRTRASTQRLPRTENRTPAARPVLDDRRIEGAVLIVDDNARFRTRARRQLEADGFTVVAEAGDGASALEAARLHRPEMVLLDIGLPDMSGLSVAERLTARPDGPAVVVTSTHDAADFGDLLAGSGACGFVPKASLSGDAISAFLSPRRSAMT